MPRVLIICDKFKGTLSSAEANRALAAGLGSGFETRDLQVSDGGQGLLAALAQNQALQSFSVPCRDALGRWRSADLAQLGDIVYIESSQANGLHLLATTERQIWQASTAGVGDLLLAAWQRTPSQIYLGLGSSATCDGGLGCLGALGFGFWDLSGQALAALPTSLAQIARVTFPTPPATGWPRLTLLADVHNPILGPRGGVQVYAPQKGASTEQVQTLEAAMAHWVQLLEVHTGQALRQLQGGGAAGGLGLALHALLGAEFLAGAAWVLQALQLEQQLAWADWVITGEGCFDESSLEGKITGDILSQAAQAGKPVALVCGQIQSALPAGVKLAQSLVNIRPQAADSRAQALLALQLAAQAVATDMLASSA